MKTRTRMALMICSILLWAGTSGGSKERTMTSQDVRPLTISNFRRFAPDLLVDQFAWGNGSQLFYVRRHPSGRFIYLQDPSNERTDLITKGFSPIFLKFSDRDALYFLHETGYWSDKEIWAYSIFPRSGVQGEHKVSRSPLMIQDEIFPQPDDHYYDPQLFAYRYYCDSASGSFKQIRLTRLGNSTDPFLRTAVLYSRDVGGTLPSISGWLDKETLVCFLGEQPYRLKTGFQVILPNYQSLPRNFDADHYPADQSGLLVQGLEGINKVILPRSNFSPDGSSYLVYCPERNAILQRDIQGTELSATVLPDPVRYLPIKHPVFSPDGRHVAFIGLIKAGEGDRRTIYLADIN